MATADYFSRTWKFFEANGPAGPEAYPPGGTIVIGMMRLTGELMMAWADRGDGLHVLTGLRPVGGALAGNAVDLMTGSSWNVEIQPEEELNRIIGTVNPVRDPGDVETNLTGGWGAEAPPTPD